MKAEVKQKLDAAIQYSKNICRLGASTYAEDIERTHGFVSQALSMLRKQGTYVHHSKQPYEQVWSEAEQRLIKVKSTSKWVFEEKENAIPWGNIFCSLLKEHPLVRDQNNKQKNTFWSMCIVTHKNRVGNCAEQSCIAVEYLLTHPSAWIHRIEICYFKDIDHAFVVLNRSIDSCLDDKKTWGKEAIVLCPWGSTYFYAEDELQWDAFIQNGEKVAKKVNALGYEWDYSQEQSPFVSKDISSWVSFDPRKESIPSHIHLMTDAFFGTSEGHLFQQAPRSLLIEKLKAVFKDGPKSFFQVLATPSTAASSKQKTSNILRYTFKLAAYEIACITGDLGKLKAMMRTNPTVIYKKASLYMNSLELAVSFGQQEIVKHLIASGMRIHAKTNDESSALVRAAEVGDVAMCHLLLKAVKHKRKHIIKPLLMAAYHGHDQVLKVVLNYCKKEKLTQGKDYTNCLGLAMVYATQNHHYHILKRLSGVLKNNPVSYDNYIKDSYFLAVELNDFKAADMLYSFSEMRYEGLPHPLIMAAMEKDSIALKYLIEQKKVNVNVTDEDGSTALALASNNKDLDCVKILLQAGADVNLANDLGETPLYFAMLWNEKEICRLLLASGANLNIASSVENNTPLQTDVFNDRLAEQKKRRCLPMIS